MMKKFTPAHARAFPLTCRAALALTLVVASAFVAPAAFVAHGAGGGHRALVSTDLLAHEGRHTTAQARVIVHGTRDEVTALATRHHLLIAGFLGGGAAVVTANSAELSALAADPAVHHLSGDLPVWSDMSISNRSTGADQTRAGTSGLLGIGGMAGVNGRGVGVAVIDSGISPHKALANRVIANVSLVTGDPIVTDPFGHGTHVAGIIAGSAGPALYVTNLYTGGIAPGVQLVNVRVLGAAGFGLTSDVVAGVEWAIAHRAQYNIRVINLSLGHPVTEPSATDPLCEAVAHAAQAGIVVVVSAGNNGRTADGRTILGGITSPGNSPYALTVGAVNTWGTVDRRDDTVTTYSSRGPTAFDLAVKPDVAAPGNKIVSLEASGSYLAATYTFLHRAGSGQNAYMQLSGTSMAAPMVSGEVALLLQGTPSLNPAQVKFAVQSGATYMPDGGLMGAGAGSANFWASRNVAAGGLLPVVGGLLMPSGVSFWDAGTLSARLYAGQGLRLLSLLDVALVWADPSRLHFGDLNLVGLLNPLAAVAPNRLLWGEVDGWTSGQQIIWGTTVYDPQGQQIIWGTDQTTQDNQIIWGTAMTAPDPR
jgi:serine protease AprX